MSTCQIEVVEFGESMERPWVQSRTEGVVLPRNGCLCNCTCPCNDSVRDATDDKYDVSA